MASVRPSENDALIQSSTSLQAVLHGGATVNFKAETVPGADATPAAPSAKWPGWPGDCVFRLVVPAAKVGSIIGRKGEVIKKMCDESRAKIRILEGSVGMPDRIVLISATEEPEVPMSPAMDAVVRVFRRINGLPENVADDKAAGASGVAFCSSRLLVPNPQAISLIGKQGSSIRSIQEGTGASVRVLSGDEVSSYVSEDERIVELQGEALRVLKALEAVVGHLRKFLVDHSVLPLFEKYTTTVQQELQLEPLPEKPMLHATSQTGLGFEYPLPFKRESLFLERELQLESQISASGLPTYGQDSGLASVRSSLGLGRPGAPVITQVSQTMQIPLSYAEDIIGAAGQNIAYIRRASGAILRVQESRIPDEIMVEIKGTSSQVQVAQELIQESIANHHREPLTSSYAKLDTALRPAYPPQLGSSYPSSSSLSSSSQLYGSYGSPRLRGYNSYRL